jgi:hypothetical protein
VTSDRGVERDHGRGIVAWGVLVEALMRPVVVEMALVLVEDGAGVSLVVDQHPVGALVADAANEPFGIAVCLWGLGRDFDDAEAFGGEDGVEGVSELAVPVADQVKAPG